MGNFTARIMTNKDPGFYPIMGPFLSRREIVKELGFPVWDENNKVWFIAVDRGAVLGFSALRLDKNSVALCSAYVLPSYRGRGIYTLMITARLEYARENGLHYLTTTATEESKHALEKAGFVQKRITGRYTRMELEL